MTSLRGSLQGIILCHALPSLLVFLLKSRQNLPSPHNSSLLFHFSIISGTQIVPTAASTGCHSTCSAHSDPTYLDGWPLWKKSQGNNFLGCHLQIGGSIPRRESFSSFYSFMPLSLWWWGSSSFCDALEVSSLLSRCKVWSISSDLSTLDFSPVSRRNLTM